MDWKVSMNRRVDEWMDEWTAGPQRWDAEKPWIFPASDVLISHPSIHLSIHSTIHPQWRTSSRVAAGGRALPSSHLQHSPPHQLQPQQQQQQHLLHPPSPPPKILSWSTSESVRMQEWRNSSAPQKSVCNSSVVFLFREEEEEEEAHPLHLPSPGTAASGSIPRIPRTEDLEQALLTLLAAAAAAMEGMRIIWTRLSSSATCMPRPRPASRS